MDSELLRMRERDIFNRKLMGSGAKIRLVTLVVARVNANSSPLS